MNFGAVLAQNTRAAAAEASQRPQSGVDCRRKHSERIGARILNVARTFGTEILRFCGRTSRDFARKFFKIGTMSAANACTQPKKDTDDLSMHVAQDEELCMSSAVFFAAKFAVETRDFRWKSRI